jgi:alanine dehydrogenase
VTEVASPIHPARIVHFDQDANSRGGSPVSIACTQEGSVPLAGYLAQCDIIINCVLQDTNAPLILLDDDDLAALRPNSLIVDVSRDASMGFSLGTPHLV